MIDECDELYAVWKKYQVKARKPYKCNECFREIEAGELYSREVGLNKSEGKWDTWHLCLHCAAAANWLLDQCNGYIYGMVQEDLHEHWRYELISTLSLGRLIIGMRRKWRDKAGNLMPVPVV